MKIYVDVQLVREGDAVVERVRIKGATERGSFDALTKLIENAVRDYAWDVMAERE